MADYSQLPSEVLAQLLKLVSVRHRLSSCSLVHSTWAAADLAATDSIHMEKHSSEYIDASDLLRWLEQHGQSVSSVSFSTKGLIASSIFSSQLQELKINYGVLELPDTQHSSSILAAATGLTRLELSCSLSSHTDSLSVLSALRNLQYLELSVVHVGGSAACREAHKPVWAPVPGSLFSDLVKLTYLELEAGLGGATEETFEHFGCLTNLQHLGLSNVWRSPESGVRVLNGLVCLSELAQLTSLAVVDCRVEFRTDSKPLLTPLTNIRELQLRDIDYLDPAVLAGMTQMQILSLGGEVLQNGDAVSGMLAVMQGMQQLTNISFLGGFDHYAAAPSGGSAATAAAAAASDSDCDEDTAAAALAIQRQYAALTASTQLQRMYLSTTFLLPGVWQHMFGSDKHLPHLTSIDFEDLYSELDSPEELEGDPVITDADLASIAGCCPNLCSLWLDDVVLNAGTCVQPLLQLTRLTDLSLTCTDTHEEVVSDQPGSCCST